MKRRAFLKSLIGLASVVGIPYSLWRGIRYPRLSLETPSMSNTLETNAMSIEMQDCFECRNIEWFDQYKEFPEAIFLRAYAPQPRINILRSNKEQVIILNNVPPEAVASNSIQLPIEESIRGITRILKIPPTDQAMTVSWDLLFGNEGYKFASIGDTGGAQELGWCLSRAEQLGVKFFLHLGDFNYQASDYETAVKQFMSAAIPCYVAVGNHDFHDNGLIVDEFLANIGPLNNAFVIDNVRYVNLDTAASFFPVSRGKRADLLRALAKDNGAYDDSVLFTHRPFYDPRPDLHQDLGNNHERDWLVSLLKKSQIDTVLTGHIHNYFDVTSQGVRLIISGQGLAHEDLIHKKQTAKILIGNVKAGQKIDYQAEALNMPFDRHCHPHVSDWRKDNDTRFARKINQLCESQDKKNI